MEYYILLSPIVIGTILGLINNPSIENNVDKFQNLLSTRKEKITPYSGKMNRFLIRPFLWFALKIKEWTNDIAHPGFKSGLRVSLYLYLIELFLYLFITLTMLIIILVVVGVILWILGKILASASDTETTYKYRKTFYKKDNDLTDHVGLRGNKIYSGSNWFNEELKGRVDNDGNIYSGTNWLSEEKIGRIDKDGNIFQGTNYFNESKVGRIDEDGNIHKGSNWFNEEKTGRIDDDGNVYKGNNWFNEEKEGRTGI